VHRDIVTFTAKHTVMVVQGAEVRAQGLTPDPGGACPSSLFLVPIVPTTSSSSAVQGPHLFGQMFATSFANVPTVGM
jgi:hypothetical protein